MTRQELKHRSSLNEIEKRAAKWPSFQQGDAVHKARVSQHLFYLSLNLDRIVKYITRSKWAKEGVFPYHGTFVDCVQAHNSDVKVD